MLGEDREEAAVRARRAGAVAKRDGVGKTGMEGENEVEPGGEAIPLAHGSSRLKWVVLALGAFQLFASYYTLDIPAALHDKLKDEFAGDSKVMSFEMLFGLMYTVYSVPNVVLPFVGGYLVDRYGAARMNVLFCVLLVFGQLVTTLGIWTKSASVSLLGRSLFGAGAESLCVGVSVLLATWFAGAQVALAMGISLSVSRFGSVINNVASPALARGVNMSFAFMFGGVLLGVGLLSASAMHRIETRRQAELAERGSQVGARLPGLSLSMVAAWPPSFWMLMLSCMLVYGTILPFNNVASAFLIERECGGACCTDGGVDCQAHLDAEKAASLRMGIPFAISAVGVPILGFLVDRYGQRASLALVAAVCLVVVHSLLAATSMGPVFPLVLQGLGYSIFCAALWPSISLVVPKGEVGSALGLVTAMQNLALAVIPLAVGGIRNHSGSYHAVEVFFLCLASVGVVVGISLNVYDKLAGQGVLNWTTTRSSADSRHEDDLVWRKVGSSPEDKIDHLTTSARLLVVESQQQQQQQEHEHNDADPQFAGAQADQRDEKQPLLPS
ncbi:Major facilitator superfamily domain-containing protein 1 [Durusdinium trenchii]|uniref:Lysosomal dipeptide transporter MFSD1 n=1 Tax=Durusdinium trenchii TaxID=1381693 RepID=A0ABP0I9X6_9DINO